MARWRVKSKFIYERRPLLPAGSVVDESLEDPATFARQRHKLEVIPEAAVSMQGTPAPQESASPAPAGSGGQSAGAIEETAVTGLHRELRPGRRRKHGVVASAVYETRGSAPRDSLGVGIGAHRLEITDDIEEPDESPADTP